MESESLLVAAATAAAVTTASYMMIARSADKRQRKSPFTAKIEADDINSIKELFHSSAPFSVEIAVHHIGRNISIYASVPAKWETKAKQILDKAYPGRWSESDVSVIFHHGGEYDAASANFSKSKLDEIDLGAIDFSAVNEIGEGASVLIQKEGSDFALYAVASAPSQFQLREIMASLVGSLKKVDCRMARDKAEIAAKFQ